MKPIIITAILKPKEGLEEQVLTALKTVQNHSRQEDGCIRYDLHQTEDHVFVLYESWENNDALESHAKSKHYQEYREQMAKLISTREVYKLNLVE